MDPSLLQMFMSSMGGGQGQGGGGRGGLIGGSQIGQILQGIFGNSGKPYESAEKELGDFYNRARDVQNPFLNMGKEAIPQFQEWLKGMKDPSGFINNLMGKYSESPWAKYQQEQALRASGNMGSASGLNGSTPMSQFNQENARNISSQDMNQWLQNVLGINTQYGAGQNAMIQGGQHAADALTNINSEFGKAIAGMQFGKRAGEQQDRNSIWGGLFG